MGSRLAPSENEDFGPTKNAVFFEWSNSLRADLDSTTVAYNCRTRLL